MDLNWIKTWEYFGYDVKKDIHKSAYKSAYDLVEDDPDSADYIYGWYLYLWNKYHLGKDDQWYDSYGVINISAINWSERRKEGYKDAKSHYESEID